LLGRSISLLTEAHESIALKSSPGIQAQQKQAESNTSSWRHVVE